MNQRPNHSHALEILQTQYSNNIIDYTRLTSKVVLLHYLEDYYDHACGNAFEISYYKLAVQDGEHFKVYRTKFASVRCEKDGTITTERTFLGINKKTYFDKTGKRISKPENY